MSNIEYITPLPKWVRAEKYEQLSGVSLEAIKTKRRDGVWLDGVHWIKAPDGKIMIDWRKCDNWAEEGWTGNGKSTARG